MKQVHAETLVSFGEAYDYARILASMQRKTLANAPHSIRAEVERRINLAHVFGNESRPREVY